MSDDARFQPSVGEADGRIPVTVLTGFLGSGKTTMLNGLLVQPAFTGTGVVVNEFGDTDFNDVAFSQARAEVVAANAGCLCCQSSSALVPSLREVERRARHVGPLSRIVIETSGLAAPAPLLQALIGDPQLVSRYRLAGLITVVDAVTGWLSLSESHEAREQIVFADVIVMSKCDVAEPEAIAALRRRLRALNPGAAIEDAASASSAAEWLHRLEAATSRGQASRTAIRESGSGHSSGQVRSFTIRRGRPASRAGLALWMDLISAYLGCEILRMKGVLDVEGEPRLVESVRHVFHPPVVLDRSVYNRDSAVVVIAQRLGRERIERAFEALDFEPLSRPLEPQAFGRFKDIMARLRSP